jgi:multiple antibiotic resistance protein
LAQPISKLLGRTGINIITRLLRLLLSAIAIEFITTGLVELLPGLAGR